MRAIVTGASAGIGRGVARVLAQAGWQVGLVARTASALEALAAVIAADGGEAQPLALDLRDPAAVRDGFAELIARLGGVDALVNNAGLVIRKDVFALSDDEWRAMLDTNVSGLFHATRAVLPAMRAQGGGHVVNISSISGRVPLPGGSAYAATKFAVTGFSQSLFHEVRDFGIRVTTVYPGSVDSASHRHDATGDHRWKATPEDIGRAVLSALQAAPGCCVSEIEVRPLARPPRGGG
jgi:NADP-dependent 3-hydroxy acid dehydrogenase YdfG